MGTCIKKITNHKNFSFLLSFYEFLMDREGYIIIIHTLIRALFDFLLNKVN